VENDIVLPLESHGVQTWYSQESILSASHWERSILQGLKECDWFLVVMSERSARSEYVKDEVHWAVDNRPGRIIPVLMEDCDLTEFHIRLRRIEYIDFRQDYNAGCAKLLAVFGIKTLLTLVESVRFSVLASTDPLPAGPWRPSRKPGSARSPDACLAVIEGPDSIRGTVYPLWERKPTLIGRGPACDLWLPDTAISRTHAKIEPGPEGYELTDLQSSNGTHVNGQPVSRHGLKSGDMISVGPVTLWFLSGDDLSRISLDEVQTLAERRRAELEKGAGDSPTGVEAPTE
jgi:hypothetical protein